MADTRHRAHRKVEREVIPSYLKDTFADIDHWQGRIDFWTHQLHTTDPSKPWYPTIQRKLAQCEEILASFNQDASQLNRKLK